MFEQVLEAFREAVGKDYTHISSERIQKYKWATIPIERVIAAVVQPGSVEEVQRVVAIANEYNVKLYPISTGNNWGYGSANPVRDNNVIVDLSRMNRILEVNTELAYAVIEPGVTQQQLYERLSSEKTGLMMDPTGSGPNCSILGNTVERGYGISPYGDHFASLCGMEVVLANGQILRTGFGHFESSTSTYTYKYGVGPYLDGLFTQSNLGIITSIGVWLMPEPEHFEACYFSCEHEHDLGSLIDAVRWLLLHRVVKGTINIVHRNRALTMLTQYPWEQMSGKTPLSEAVFLKMAKQRKVGAWNGVTALYGTREEVAAARSVIKRVLRGKITQINFITDQRLRLIERFPNMLGFITRMHIAEMIKVLKPSYGILRGIPAEVSLPTPYWRMKTPVPTGNINPARDNCGLIWFAPILPMKKEDAEEFIRIIRPIFARYGFEDCITFTAVNSRSFDCTLPILYDRTEAEEAQRAHKCYEALLKQCMNKGYLPYRLGIQSMAYVVEKDDVFWDVMEKLKGCLDPRDVLSPGRYSR
jgi:4-cresol dehydrogenase (hydroxylating)